VTAPEPMPPPEQEEVVRNACLALLDEAPADWKRIQFEFYSTVGIDSAEFKITRQDGSTFKLQPPMAVMEPLGDLRSGMYQEGKGSWYTARIVIDPPGRYSVEFDYDNEPAFEPPLVPGVYALDFEHFPRTPEHTPDWLRAKLDEAQAG
jgi:hypothetical protein